MKASDSGWTGLASDSVKTESRASSLQSIPTYLTGCTCFGIHLPIASTDTDQGTHSNSMCFPSFFLVLSQISPVPIYFICDLYLRKTDLADLSSFKQNLEIFAANIEIYFTFTIRELEQTKFPVFCPNFQIPCVFPDRHFFPSIFHVFPVQWVP